MNMCAGEIECVSILTIIRLDIWSTQIYGVVVFVYHFTTYASKLTDAWLVPTLILPIFNRICWECQLISLLLIFKFSAGNLVN